MQSFRDHPEQAAYLSTIAVSASTLVEITAMVLGRTWAGWETAVMVLWYCDVALSIVAALAPYWIMFRHEHVHVENLSPTALYPATAILSSASAGSVVIAYTPLSVRASFPILLLSIFLLGLGFLIMLAILANYTSRLLINHTPEPEKAMASFIPVAAISNAAYAASSLGRSAGPTRNLLAEYGKGYVANSTVGLAFYGAGVAAALGLLGFATYWMLLSCLVVAEDIREAPFSLNYWSALYPFGVYALAFGQLAIDFDSPTFRTLNTIMTCSLLLIWLFCLAMTVPRAVLGEIFLKDAEKKDSTERRTASRRLGSD
ncbi:MAG: hypothetical protein CYPHOPRED_000683 [Cyphobasidiales sp. Tagirdzhanova-0007]|nr:MAG: hypothetical protein CYPHOPRED_000683 [Cyphobasidiales sp. Tagirdzhanova-0007]